MRTCAWLTGLLFFIAMQRCNLAQRDTTWHGPTGSSFRGFQVQFIGQLLEDEIDYAYSTYPQIPEIASTSRCKFANGGAMATAGVVDDFARQQDQDGDGFGRDQIVGASIGQRKKREKWNAMPDYLKTSRQNKRE